MISKDNLSDIHKTLINDGVLLHPTDTIWGLGCSAHSEVAIEKIYHIKKRDRSKPLILLVASLEMLKTYVPDIHPRIETLLHYHEKPLTIIYENVKNLPSFALAEDKSAAIRIVKDHYCQSIISELDAPLVSTSANLAGDPFPTCFDDIPSLLLDQVDFISKERRSEIMQSQPSVLLKYDNEGDITFLRT